MKKIITILIGCSLALAIGVRAAEQDEQEKKPVQKSKPVQKQQFTPKQHTAPQTVPNTHVPGAHNPPNTYVPAVPNQHKGPTVPYNAKTYDNVPKHQPHTMPPVQTNKVPVVPINKAPVIQSNNVPAVPINKAPVVQPNNVPAVPINKAPVIQSNKVPVAPTNTQTRQTFHPRHQDFHAQPNTAIASAQFNQHRRIHGSENWHGNRYNAFRSYRPQWHDRHWWHSHHNHIVLIGGGWYFWNAGYWYPAWGYDSSAAYYPYDGPIYVGNTPTPPDQVVADVQTSLQEQGYYHGEVDGLVGPLTQEALGDYQRAQGLEPTAAIDEPTLESLGLG